MRVLIVNPKIYVYGGAELLLVKLCNFLTKKGIRNSILTTSILPEVQKELLGTNIIIQKKPKIYRNILNCNEILALYKGVQENFNNFDLINVHNYPAELSVFRCKKPVVWMCNEPSLYLSMLNSSFKSKLLTKVLFDFERFIVRHFIKNAVVADKFNAKRFKKIYNGMTPYISNYGIDYEFFSKGKPEKIKCKMDLDNKFVILHVGMLQPFKNQMESLRIVKKINNKIPNLVLILAGYWIERYKLELENYIKENDLEDIVMFTGHMNREDLRDLYHTCNVLLHPIKSQGGWLSPFEALCVKKPIVVSYEMTASEIIAKEDIGVVTNDFEDVILDIYRNSDKYHKIAERGEKWVKENLSWDNFCEKMLNLFYDSIGNKKNE